MYDIFRENRKRIPYNQIRELYKGKWVLLVNLEGPLLAWNEEEGGMEPCDPISAEILTVSDIAYEGKESGIYEDLKNNPEKYGSWTEMDCRVGNRLPMNYFLVKDGVPVD